MSPPVDMGPEGPIEVVQGAVEDRIVVRAALDRSLAEPLRSVAMDLPAEGGGRRRAAGP